MKVRATEMGYYGEVRRRVGDVFLLKTIKKSKKVIDPKTKKESVVEVVVPPEKQFSSYWMEVVEDGAKVDKPRSERQFGPNVKSRKAEDYPGAVKAAHEPKVEDEAEDAKATGNKKVI